jgi:type II secretory pathway predicted ATPase ExeA
MSRHERTISTMPVAPSWGAARYVFLRHRDNLCARDRVLVSALPRDRPYMRRKLFHDDRPPVRAAIEKARGMPSAAFFSEYFGLRERPFTLLPDPDFLYWSKAHRRAYTVLEYGVMSRAPITVITGEVGAGKTTLVQKLLSEFDASTVVGLISNAQGGRGDLLQWALSALDVPGATGTDYVTKHQALQTFLINNYAAGRRVVLIIDEAQNLSREGLEELRMMTNINAGKDELVQLILVGQPELRDMISGYDMRQFAQRVMASFHLPNMDLETTEAYVRHRLVHAGGTGDEFTRGAIALIHRYSDGVPRLVNKFADFAMVYAASAERRIVDEMTVCEVNADDLFMMPGMARKDAAE